MLRTWSFVLKQRGLGHEGWRGGKRKCLFSISATCFALRTAPMYEDQLGPLRSGEDWSTFISNIMSWMRTVHHCTTVTLLSSPIDMIR